MVPSLHLATQFDGGQVRQVVLSNVREGFFQKSRCAISRPLKNYGRFDTVAPEEKFPCVVPVLKLLIVVFDLGMHFNFFEMGNMLFLFCFFSISSLFSYFKFPIVHYSANRRFRVWERLQRGRAFLQSPSEELLRLA